MTEPTPTTPSPIAVPWTPGMSVASPTPPMQMPPQPYSPTQTQVSPAHPTPQVQIPAQAQPMPQPYQPEQRPQLHAQTPISAPAPVAAHPAQLHQPAYPGQLQTPVPHVQPPMAQQAQRPQPIAPHHGPTPQPLPPQHPHQNQTIQQHQPQHKPQPYAAHTQSQPPIAPQNLHAGPPPLSPHMQGQINAAPMPAGNADQPQSKSLLAGLLKRSPKPHTGPSDMPAASTARRSLFNKNFMLGGLTGLVIGAVVLPMVIGMFSRDTSQSQARNFTQSSAAMTPPSIAEGGSFIDDAIASDVP